MCVYLQDGLKVEGEAVPQSELPTGGSGDKAAALRGPLEEEIDSSNTHNTPTTQPQHTHTHAYPDHKHGTLDFVGGGSDKLCGDSIHGIVQHPQRRNQLKEHTGPSGRQRDCAEARAANGLRLKLS